MAERNRRGARARREAARLGGGSTPPDRGWPPPWTGTCGGRAAWFPEPGARRAPRADASASAPRRHWPRALVGPRRDPGIARAARSLLPRPETAPGASPHRRGRSTTACLASSGTGSPGCPATPEPVDHHGLRLVHPPLLALRLHSPRQARRGRGGTVATLFTDRSSRGRRATDQTPHRKGFTIRTPSTDWPCWRSSL
jgi:hypothetical protein